MFIHVVSDAFGAKSLFSSPDFLTAEATGRVSVGSVTSLVPFDGIWLPSHISLLPGYLMRRTRFSPNSQARRRSICPIDIQVHQRSFIQWHDNHSTTKYSFLAVLARLAPFLVTRSVSLTSIFGHPNTFIRQSFASLLFPGLGKLFYGHLFSSKATG